MKKIKNQKRVYALVLVVLMLATIFTVSASAITPAQYGFCDCFDGTEWLYDGDVLVNGEKDFAVKCHSCDSEYIVRGVVYEDVEKNYGDQTIVFVFEFSDEVEGADIQLRSWEGEPIGGTAFYIQSAEKVGVEENNSGMVGSMVGTITQGVGGILVGVGSSIVGFFDSAVLDDNGNLTTFATWALAFLGIAFGLGVVKFITYLVKK